MVSQLILKNKKMKNILKTKTFFLSTGIIIWQFLILPIKSLALEYTPLEGKAFVGFGDPITASTKEPLKVFLSQVFSFGLAIAVALAVIMIVWGGVEIMTTDSWSGKTNGKEKIWNAIWGLLLALVSWLILYIINPDLLNFQI
jgi:hypothetical protein